MKIPYIRINDTVSDEEINNVINYTVSQQKAQYDNRFDMEDKATVMHKDDDEEYEALRRPGEKQDDQDDDNDGGSGGVMMPIPDASV